jgi:hypothetical protein
MELPQSQIEMENLFANIFKFHTMYYKLTNEVQNKILPGHKE